MEQLYAASRVLEGAGEFGHMCFVGLETMSLRKSSEGFSGIWGFVRSLPEPPFTSSRSNSLG